MALGDLYRNLLKASFAVNESPDFSPDSIGDIIVPGITQIDNCNSPIVTASESALSDRFGTKFEFTIFPFDSNVT